MDKETLESIAHDLKHLLRTYGIAYRFFELKIDPTDDYYMQSIAPSFSNPPIEVHIGDGRINIARSMGASLEDLKPYLMPSSPFPPRRITETEYLAIERKSETKHEFLAGDTFMVPPEDSTHNLICSSLNFLLYGQLRGRPCQVYPSEMRLKIQATGLYTYPDLSVVCGESEFSDNGLDSLSNPTVIIEVLSPWTESDDRGKKFQHYRELASLQEYLLISQDSPRIERYLRQENAWALSDAVGLDTVLTLPSIGCTLMLAEVYERVKFTGE